MSVTYAHLLLVDADEQRRASLLAPLAERQWYTLSSADSTGRAMEILRAETVDLVLVDGSLAAQDECAFLRHLREDEQLNALQVMVLVPAGADNLAATCLQAGANDYLFTPPNPLLLKARCEQAVQQRHLREQLSSSVQSFDEMLKLANDLQQIILPLGVALSAEKDFERLLGRIVEEALAICNADAGLLYLRTADEELRLALVQFNWLKGERPNQVQAEFGMLPISLGAEEETAGHSALVTTALTGKSLHVADVYNSPHHTFDHLHAFDARYGYRSVSCLTVPLRNERVAGVLQLVNATDGQTGRIIPFSRYHQLVAESLASQAALVLHNRTLRDRQAALLELQQELRIGREIQAGFFPAALPQAAGWELAAHLRPAREVCGDFYDAFALPGERIGLVVGDVCGKGVGAALFMALVRSLVRAFMQRHGEGTHSSSDLGHDAALLLETVRLTNSYINHHHGQDHMFATLFVGMLETGSGRLRYVNAGHEPPLLWQEGEMRRLTRSGPAAGLLPEGRYRVHGCTLWPGDSLLIYTDGVTEARDEAGRPFGGQRLAALLAGGRGTAAGQLQAIDEAVVAHTAAAEPFDDVTLLLLRRLGEPA